MIWNKRKPVVYVSGSFRAKTQWRITQNIRAAETAALQVWRAGAVAICPHMNTMNYQGELPDEIWLEGDCELVRRCDAILMLPGWESSEGAVIERRLAIYLGIPVLTLESLDGFVENWEPPKAEVLESRLAILEARLAILETPSAQPEPTPPKDRVLESATCSLCDGEIREGAARVADEEGGLRHVMGSPDCRVALK